MHCVSVVFRIREGREAAFGARVAQQAADSLASEEGCLVFDVWSDPEDPAAFLLYEVYSGRDAFAAHLETAHFKSFDADVADMVADKTVARYDRPVAVAAPQRR